MEEEKKEDEVRKLISITSWYISLQIITLLAFLGGAAFLYTEIQGLKQGIASNSIAGQVPTSPKEIKNWDEYIRSHDATHGDTAAEIVVVEFTDFQCHYCKIFNDNTRKQLLSKYGDNIRMVLKHYPLESIHPEAKQAAVAAQCALREGKFWEMTDVLFNNQDKLSTEFLIAAGKSLGLGSQYAECVTNQDTLAEVEQDIQDGARVGVQGTPAFLVNGKLVMGAIPLTQFESLIKEPDLCE